MRARRLYVNADELLAYRCSGLNDREEELYPRDVARAKRGRARTNGTRRVDGVLIDVDVTGDCGLGSDERHCQQDVEP